MSSKSSQVFFTNMRTRGLGNMLVQMEKVCQAAGIDSIDFNKKFVAIKIHFGEPGNLAFLRPNYAARMVKMVRDRGGLPFLTDANTLYKGRRDNAVAHLEAAQENGFHPLSTGCNIIIADGLKGTEFREISTGHKHCKTAKIASAIADADIIISLNHFKGHEMTSFGGALKNLGMGCASVGGKLELHSTSQPKIVAKNCVSCQVCVRNCNHQAITMVPSPLEGGRPIAAIDETKCVGCGQCVAVCRFDAARVNWDSNGALVDEKIAEYTSAVVAGKPAFHVNFIMNVSPECDCWGENDMAIVPDIGILASFDPVALDRACIDLVNQAPAIRTSVLGEKAETDLHDKLTCLHPHTDWRAGLAYAEKIGLGSQTYQMIPVGNGKECL